MATNRNPITGDKIITKQKSKSFDENFDAIFRQPKDSTEVDVLEAAGNKLNEVDDADQA